MAFHPRLRTVLLALNLLVLLLPLGGIAIFRLYESELVRQTESELISQAALTASMFREIYLGKQPSARQKKGRLPTVTTDAVLEPVADGEQPPLTPLRPQLDLANSTIMGPALPAEIPTVSADPKALEAGGELTTVLYDARRTVLSGIRIVDRSGIVVASSNTETGLSLAHREEVAAALKGESTSLLRVRNSDELPPALTSISRRARVRVFVAVPVVADDQVIGAVVASRTPLDAAKALFLIRDQLLKVGIGLLLVVLLITLLTAYYISRPVRGLIRQAERLQRGDGGGSEPLENPGIQEVAQLSAAIAEMATTLDERSSYIKTFATNVSHEFKTPLTSIHGAVEILKDHFDGMSPTERERFLDIIGSETGRLERLVRRLLDLARADTVAAGEESCDAVAVIDAVASRYRGMGVTLEAVCDSAPAHIDMGREAFESVLANLIENARQHGGESVAIQVDGRALPDAGQFVLIIQDNGPGISAGNRDKIFRPFFTTARESGGSGLGLAIVESLLNAHGGTITLETVEQGARFRVVLPLCQ